MKNEKISPEYSLNTEFVCYLGGRSGLLNTLTNQRIAEETPNWQNCHASHYRNLSTSFGGIKADAKRPFNVNALDGTNLLLAVDDFVAANVRGQIRDYFAQPENEDSPVGEIWSPLNGNGEVYTVLEFLAQHSFEVRDRLAARRMAGSYVGSNDLDDIAFPAKAIHSSVTGLDLGAPMYEPFFSNKSYTPKSPEADKAEKQDLEKIAEKMPMALFAHSKKLNPLPESMQQKYALGMNIQMGLGAHTFRV